MERQIETEQGTCFASLKTEAQITTIQAELEAASWLSQCTRWLEAVKDPTRFKLVYLLYQQDRLCGCDLANILKVSNSAVSQHLRKLKDMGLVSSYRHKQTLFYTLCQDEFVIFFTQLIPNKAVRQEPTEKRVHVQ